MYESSTFLDYEPLRPRRKSGSPPATENRSLETIVSDSTRGLSAAQEFPGRSLHAVRGHVSGHTLSFCGLLVFTAVVYFRPQQTFVSLTSIPIALIVALLTILLFIPSQLSLERSLTVRTREVNLLFVFTVTALLSVPLGIDPGNSIQTFWEPFLKAVIIFVVMVNVVRTERRLNLMFYLAFAVTWTLAIAALNDYRLGTMSVEGYRIRGVIAGGMFENANDLGVHLVIVAPLALAAGFSRNLLIKSFSWITAALAVATLVLTYSRGAFIGLLAAIVVMSWKLARRRKQAVIMALLFGGLLFVVVVPGLYWIRLLSIFDSDLDAFGSSIARSELLAHSFLVALRHPLLGIGMGNFSLVSSHSLVSHNSYTQVASEMGIGALFAYAMFITAPLNQLLRIERETLKSAELRRFYYLAVGLQASLVGFMFSSFFVSVAYYWFAYYLVAYAVCFRRLYDRLKIEGSAEHGSGNAQRTLAGPLRDQIIP